jgi:hypothetical protein
MGGFDHHRVNRLKRRYFDVTIAGDVDHYTPADWVGEDPTSNAYPSTKAASLDKEYAHMRWEAIARMLGERHVPVVRDMVSTGITDDAPATQLDFTVMYDREDYVVTFDEENGDIPMGPAEAFDPRWTDGVEFTEATEAEVVQRYISRILTWTWVEKRQIYDPTAGYIGTTPVDTANPGPLIELITVPAAQASIAAADATVTVTQVV